MDNRNVEQASEQQYAALIGIDWADRKHDICIYDCEGGSQSLCVIANTPEALAEWITKVRGDYAGRPVAIALEQSKGGLIHALSVYGFITLYPMNPATLAKYREAFSPSRAKDDPSDARLLMELLLKHRDKFRAWMPDDEQTRTLSMFSEHRRKCVDLRTKLVQGLTALLKGYFPQAVELVGGNLTSNLACDFIGKWPTLHAIRRAKPQILRAFYYGHNWRRGDLIEQNIEKIRSSVALTEDKAVVTASKIAARSLAKQIRLINGAIEEYDKQIEQLYSGHPDAFIFKSLPGAGPAMGPRLLAAFGTDRARYDRAAEIQTYSGIAPVTERSGKKQWVHCRRACPKFTRQSFHEFAGCSRKFSLWAQAHYELQRERGKNHHAAVRSLAFKWQRIIFRCWKDRKPYHDERYTHALEVSGSHLWPRIKALQNA